MRYAATTAMLLVAATASAGVRIETQERNIQTKQAEGPPQTMLVQEGNVRVATSKSGAMILTGSAVYIIDDKRRSYREMDKATMQGYANQANAAMSQMQQQMAKMTPEQREMMKKMMGANMPGAAPPAKADVFESKDTGKSDTVEGRKCRLWNISRNEKLHEEVCVVPFATLPGKEDFAKTFRKLAEAFDGLAAAAPGAPDSSKARSAINGYPVRVRRYQNGAQAPTESVLVSWNEEAIAAKMFQIPSGYKKQDMPMIGAQ